MDDSNVITLSDTDAEARREKLKVCMVAEELNNHAVQLKQMGNYVAATIAMKRAVALSPDSGFLWNGLGSCLWNLGRYEEAHHALVRSIQLLGDDPSPFCNMGMMLSSMGRKKEALSFLEKAVRMRPSDKHAAWSYSMSLLDHGEWEKGFEVYECRADFRGAKYYPKMPFPMWNGEDLNGKTLYIQSEQGVGDRILFSRYVAWLFEKWPGVKVKWLLSSPDQIALEPLLWDFTLVYDLEFLPVDIPWPTDIDYGIFLMSLPRIHGTRPDNVPPDPGIIRGRCLTEADLCNVPEPRSPSIRIGISWTGNPTMTRNHDRSIPPELLFELEADPRIQLFSLQFGSDDIERMQMRELVFDAAGEIRNERKGLTGTASVMLNLDLVITCCTANAHLAGVLGVPCWVLLCADPYWVWLRDRSDSVWYDSVKLFRQERPNDWQGVMRRVKRELGSFADQILSRRKGNVPPIANVSLKGA